MKTCLTVVVEINLIAAVCTVNCYMHRIIQCFIVL